MERFFRVETAPDDEFLAGPHFSEPIWLADIECPRCNGNGENWSNDEESMCVCELCSGMGRIQYDPDIQEHREAYRSEGVSCFRYANELIEYFIAEQAVCPVDRAEVVEFSGECVGCGLDDEPLAIPEKVLHRWDWEEFVKLFG